MKDVLIFNPYAGKGSARCSAEKIHDVLLKAGIDTDVKMTASANHAAELAEMRQHSGLHLKGLLCRYGSLNGNHII